MRTSATALILLVACVVAACSDDGPSDKQQIRVAVSEALTTKDSCTRRATQRFLEQVTAERGKAALRACRKEAGERRVKSVSIGRVAVSGPRASADLLRPTGGLLPFASLRVGLRKTAGGWKVDRAKSGTLDRPAFFRLIRKKLSSPSSGQSRDEVDCVLREFKAIENDTIVRAVLRVDPRLFVVAGATCGLRSAFSGTAIPKRAVACVQRRIRRELTSGASGRALVAAPDRVKAFLNSPQFQRLGRQIIASCVRGSSGGPRVSAATADRRVS